MNKIASVWIDAFKIGSEIHDEQGGKPTVVDGPFVKAIMSNFAYCMDKKYSVVFLNNHARTDSYIYGDVTDVRVHNGYLQCAVVMTREHEYKAFEDGIMREFSPGFDPNWLDPHTGTRKGPTLLELSYTGLAYQRNLRKPLEIQQLSTLTDQSVMYLFSQNSENLTMGGTIMARKKMSTEENLELLSEGETPEETPEELSEGELTLASLDAKLDQILAMLAPAEMSADEEEITEEMSADEEEEIKNLHRRIRSLEDENTRIQLSQRGITGTDVDLLVKLRRTDENLYTATLKRFSRPTRQEEIGVTGVTQITGMTTALEVAKAAKSAGKTGGGDLVVYLSKSHPQYVERVNEVRKALKTL